MRNVGYDNLEFAYVLIVEALVFWLLSALLVSRRLDVFDWPIGSTWPVLGGTVLACLAYAWVLVAICGFIMANKLRESTDEICEAFARSAGRVVTIVSLLVLYASIVVWLLPGEHRAISLCQLWDTACNADEVGKTFWNIGYSVYLTALLPVLTVLAGLLLTASAQFKRVSNKHARRSVLPNCVFVLVLTVTYTLQHNLQVACDSGSDGCAKKNYPHDNTTLFNRSPGPVYASCTPAIFTACSFLVSDLVVDILCGMLLLHGRSVALTISITALRALQLSAVPLLVELLNLDIPWELVWGHFIFAAILATADCLQVLIPTAAKEVPTSNNSDSDDDSQASVETANMTDTTAAVFAIEPTKRRKFMLSKTRWPSTGLRTVPSFKKRV